MRMLTNAGTAVLNLALLSPAARAQRADPAGACLGSACCGSLVFIPLIILVLNVCLLIWVARDAKARGMDNAVLWMILVMCTSIIGLIIYVSSRPQGNLIQCANCQNSRLQASVTCPHCGSA